MTPASPEDEYASGSGARVRPLPGTIPAGATGLQYDLRALGYVEEEYLLSGVARSFAMRGPRSADGAWTVAEDQAEAFVTRLLVRRPVRQERFSGTAVLEWLNVSGGVDGGPEWTLMHPHLLRNGHAWVGVSAQKVGIDGGGAFEGAHLRNLDPARYGQLLHPGDAFAYDIFTQAGLALRTQGQPLLGGMTADRILAAGASQSAFFLVTYINAIDADAAVFDGFLVHGRGAEGAALDGFHLLDGDVDLSERVRSDNPERIRSDLRVPVIVMQSETDVSLLGGGLPAQPDGEFLRLWEIAGAAHGETYMTTAGHLDDGRLPAERLAELLRPTVEVFGAAAASPINAGPQQHFVAQAALDWLDRWSRTGAAAPAAPRLEADAEGAGFVLDDHGNARGGVRTPWMDVPTATYSGLGQKGERFAALFGRTVTFGAPILQELYPGGREEYLVLFTESLDHAIAAGFLLEADRGEILGLAAAAYAEEAVPA